MGRYAGRSLTLFVAGSVCLHAAALLVLPARFFPDLVQSTPLQVTMEKRQSARALPAVSPESSLEKRRKAPEKKAVMPVQERSQRQGPPQLLAAPSQSSIAEPDFSVLEPQPRVASEPAPASAPAKEAVRAAPKADAPIGKITPPVFNAAYLRNPEPVYPVSARRRGEQGTVMLKVLVTREGTAASVSVDKTSGFAVLDQAALEAVRKWRFAPARHGAEPVESAVLVPIVFRLEGVS